MGVKEKFCPGRPTGRDLQRLRNLVREYCLGRLGFSDPDRRLEADRVPEDHPEPRVPGLIIRLIVSEEMRAEVLFLDEMEGLTVDRLDRAGGKLAMERNSQDLRRLAFDLALQLGMASAGRDDQEAERVKDPEDLPGRQALKPRHRRKDGPQRLPRSWATS